MSRCPLSYTLLQEDEIRYSKQGLKRFSPDLVTLEDFPYSAAEQRDHAKSLAAKLSIQGVQPKLSATLNTRAHRFEMTDRGGTYIIKPQSGDWEELPQNEDVTMRMAACVGLEVPLHGMIYSQDGSLSYVIRRFDRPKRGEKYALEDFAQLSGQSRETKYNSSMEKVAKVLQEFATFPIIEKEILFRMTLFSFLVGNEDMHLKNFSLITRGGKTTLSPMYDLLNSTIVLKKPEEELALPIRGKRNRITKDDLIAYFAREVLSISLKRVESILEDVLNKRAAMEHFIEISFLSEVMKKKYIDLLSQRYERIGL